VTVYLQALLFLFALLHFVLAAVAVVVADGASAIGEVLFILFMAGFWSLWILGLWRRQNWLRWLTIICNIYALLYISLHLPTLARLDAQGIISYLQIPVLVIATALFVRSSVHCWYQHQVGPRR
jgi:hypothetical protein